MIRYGFLVVLLAVSLNAIGSETDINLKNLCKNQIREGLNTLHSDIKVLVKQYDYLTFIQWGDLNKDNIDDLAFFVESEKGKTKLLVYIYNKKEKKYILRGVNDTLPPSYEHLPSVKEFEDYQLLSSITIDKLLILKFSKINYHTIFSGVDNQYKFQYRDHKMKLIGAELLEYSRAKGDGFAESINYLSGKKESYEVVDVHKKLGKSKWSKLKKAKLMELEEFLYEDVN